MLCYYANGQGQILADNCGCPESYNGVNSKKFLFSNGRSIVVCGDTEMLGKKNTYTEFALFQCGHIKSLENWGAIKHCYVQQQDDTLIIEELFDLPIGEGSQEIYAPFFVTEFFYENGQLIKINTLSKRLPYYTEAKKIDAFKKYRELKKGNYENTISIANMLFWAFVSGNTFAENYFVNVEQKFGPFDGVVAEEWNWLLADYKLYKELKKGDKTEIVQQ